MEEKIRVLVVDDSFLMRKIISDIIDSNPGFEVIGTAKDGKEALDKVYSLKPDIVTLDINIPLIDGISVLEEIMRKQPTRVIMVSAYTLAGTSATIKALELGALDFIAKPSGEISLDLTKLTDEIISKIKIASRVNLDKFSILSVEPVKKQETAIKKIVVIGASTGGPKAVLDIMQHIPAENNAVFIIVQHMPKGFTSSFAERISWQTGIKTKEAEEKDIIMPGKVYVAPAGYHLILEKAGSGAKIKLTEDPMVNFVRPSIDVTMNSVAGIFGKDVIGVILTGMGRDGLEGVESIKSKGGYIIVQDERTSVVWGMPRVVCDAGLADEVLPLFRIPKAVMERIEKED